MSSVLDDYSRYIISWELFSTMKAPDVERSVHQAIVNSEIHLNNMPKILSDNGSCYISGELKKLLIGYSFHF